ncbi:MAG: hypothetical protein ACAH95_16895 [Fimbriimonas sp.]
MTTEGGIHAPDVGKTSDNLGAASVILDEAGSCKIRVRLDSAHTVRFEPLALNADGQPFAAASFACDIQDAACVTADSTVQIVDEQGHFIARCSGDKVWLVFVVNKESISDSCLVEPKTYDRAIRQAVEESRSLGV